MIVGVAVQLERFYKPELDSAHTARRRAARLDFRKGAMIPLPG